MWFPDDFKAMVSEDIQRLTDSHELSSTERRYLHRQIDGRYQACVKDWYNGFWGVDIRVKTLNYNLIDPYDESIRDNLQMMKAKLETFLFQMNAIDTSGTPSTQVNVTTNVNINTTFEQARAKIEDMASLTDEQTREALDKVSEIESVVNSEGSKKSKWEKIKPILIWLADKSFDVAMTIIPLLFKVQ